MPSYARWPEGVFSIWVNMAIASARLNYWRLTVPIWGHVFMFSNGNMSNSTPLEGLSFRQGHYDFGPMKRHFEDQNMPLWHMTLEWLDPKPRSHVTMSVWNSLLQDRSFSLFPPVICSISESESPDDPIHGFENEIYTPKNLKHMKIHVKLAKIRLVPSKKGIWLNQNATIRKAIDAERCHLWGAIRGIRGCVKTPPNPRKLIGIFQ